MVKDVGDHFVKKPVDSTQIWNDSGSGANDVVAIYKLIAPIGYECLGMVAVANRDRKPDLNRYRCVKQDLIRAVTLASQIWNDDGSGADYNFAAYAIDSYTSMGKLGLFFGAASHDKPTIAVYALRDDKTTTE